MSLQCEFRRCISEGNLIREKSCLPFNPSCVASRCTEKEMVISSCHAEYIYIKFVSC